MKTEKEIREEAERLFKVFMNPSNKKPLRDDAYTTFHALMWVLKDEVDIIENRLREINAGRHKTPKAK